MSRSTISWLNPNVETTNSVEAPFEASPPVVVESFFDKFAWLFPHPANTNNDATASPAINFFMCVHSLIFLFYNTMT